jgi:hypothetical protein
MEPLIEQQFKDLVANEIAAPLKSMGFKRKAGNLNRASQDIVQVLTVQRSQWNEGGRLTFYVNVGIYSDRVHKVLWPLLPTPTFPGTPNCCWDSRLNGIDARARAGYGLSLTEAHGPVVEAVRHDIREVVVPFFMEYTSLVSLSGWIDAHQRSKRRWSPSELHRIVILHGIGRTEDAYEAMQAAYVDALSPHTGGQINRSAIQYTEQVADALGLHLDPVGWSA